MALYVRQAIGQVVNEVCFDIAEISALHNVRDGKVRQALQAISAYVPGMENFAISIRTNQIKTYVRLSHLHQFADYFQRTNTPYTMPDRSEIDELVATALRFSGMPTS